MEPKPGMLMDEETANQLRAIMAKGVLGAGVFKRTTAEKPMRN